MSITISSGCKLYPHVYTMDEAQTTQGTTYYPIGLYWESGIASNEVWWDTTSQVEYPRVDPWTNATFFNNILTGERDLTSYEINLISNRTYISVGTDTLQYSGVELQLCYDWEDSDDNTGTNVLTIWSSSYHPTTRINMTNWLSRGSWTSSWHVRTRAYLRLVTNTNIVQQNGWHCIDTPYYYN